MYKAKLIFKEHGYFKRQRKTTQLFCFLQQLHERRKLRLYFIPLSLKKKLLISPWFADKTLTPTASGQRFRFFVLKFKIFSDCLYTANFSIEKTFPCNTKKRVQDIMRSIHLALVHSKDQLRFKKIMLHFFVFFFEFLGSGLV